MGTTKINNPRRVAVQEVFKLLERLSYADAAATVGFTREKLVDFVEQSIQAYLGGPERPETLPEVAARLGVNLHWILTPNSGLEAGEARIHWGADRHTAIFPYREPDILPLIEERIREMRDYAERFPGTLTSIWIEAA